MMIKLTALLLCVLLFAQCLPAQTLAEAWNEAFSDALDASSYNTVEFIADSETVESMLVQDGATVDAFPTAPAREGYTFLGWQANGATISAPYTPDADTTIYAIYSEDYPAFVADGNLNGVTVHIEAPAGALPEDVRFRMTPVTLTDAEWDAAEDALDGELLDVRFVDISFMRRVDGVMREVQPLKSVRVEVRLRDMDSDDIAATHVIHFGEDGPEDVSAVATDDGKLVFEAESFSTYGFGSILSSLLSWSTSLIDFSVQGLTSLLKPKTTAIQVGVEEGLEVLNAYNVTATGGSTLLSALKKLWVKITVGNGLNLGARETVDVYGVVNGKTTDIIAENVSPDESLSIALDGVDGFAIVRDTGFRHRNVTVDNVTLDGMMPKAAEAEAQDAAASEAVAALEGETLAAYDISIMDGADEYQPDADHPIEVTIEHLDIEEGASLRVVHIADDGTVEDVPEFTVDGDKVTFEAKGFSIYAVVVTADQGTEEYEYHAGANAIKIRYEDENQYLINAIDSATIELTPGNSITVSQIIENNKTIVVGDKTYTFENAYFYWTGHYGGQKCFVTSFSYESLTGYNSYLWFRGTLYNADGTVNQANGHWEYNPTGVLHLVYTTSETPRYTITYHTNIADDNDDTNSITLFAGQNAKVASYATVFGAVPTNYTFKGWASSADSDNVEYEVDELITSSIHRDYELYAVWEQPSDTVVITYTRDPVEGGRVSLSVEGVKYTYRIWNKTLSLNKNPVGSTATVNEGFKFLGWYKDGKLVTSNYQLTPEQVKANLNKTSESYENTSFVAKYEEETVTLTFKAGNGVKSVVCDSGLDAYVSCAGNNTSEMTIVVKKSTGSSLTVHGVAAEGYVVNSWTIDLGEEKTLSSSYSLITSKTDDPSATNFWTDRAYIAYAEIAKTVVVTKTVEVVGTLAASDVDLTVYFALKDKQSGNFLMKDGKIWTESIRIIDGVPQSSSVSFSNLTSGTYEVWEVADADAGNLRPGNKVGTDSQEKDVIVSNIRTLHGSSSSNNVTVNDAQTSDTLQVINTYSHENETIDVSATKQWFTTTNNQQEDQANKNVPAGAWAVLSLYVKDTEIPVRSIRLDGTPDDDGEDEAWKAVFDGVARVDSEGSPISYVVKETSYSETIGDVHFYQLKGETENGGTIKNAVMFGNIKIYKQFEIQPPIDLSGYIGNLVIRVTGPYGYSKDITFSGNSSNYETLISDLPAGTYTVEELNYENLIDGRKWYDHDSYIKAGNGAQMDGQTKVTFEVATGGGSNDTVDIRIRNNYTQYDIKATKVWEDGDEGNTDHPEVELVLYKVDSNGNKSKVGETQKIAANATGNDLTVSWVAMHQSDNYVLEETSVNGYETTITGDKFSGFIVTNTRVKTTSLTLTKQVTGGFGDTTKDFTFTFSVEDAEDGATYPSRKANREGTVTDGGTFTLRHNESITITVPLGKKITITEDDGENGAYTKKWAISGNTQFEVRSNNNTNDTIDLILTGDETVTITNDKQPVAPTGYRATLTPYILLLLAGAFLLTVSRGRRKRRWFS